MILNLDGRPARNTKTRFDPNLVKVLILLDDLLRQNGLGLFCTKCQRMGQPDGVEAKNDPGNDTFRLVCGCSTREFHKPSGREEVKLH